MRFSYDDVKKLEGCLASLPDHSQVNLIRKNEVKMINQDGNELKFTSYANVSVLLEYILENCNTDFLYDTITP